MARADIKLATSDIATLYHKPFGGKRMGRYVLSRDQVASLLRVEVAHDKTIRHLGVSTLNSEGLVLFQSGKTTYSVVAARKAKRWRKVPRAILSDLIGPIASDDDTGVDEEGAEEAED